MRKNFESQDIRKAFLLVKGRFAVLFYSVYFEKYEMTHTCIEPF